MPSKFDEGQGIYVVPGDDRDRIGTIYSTVSHGRAHFSGFRQKPVEQTAIGSFLQEFCFATRAEAELYWTLRGVTPCQPSS